MVLADVGVEDIGLGTGVSEIVVGGATVRVLEGGGGVDVPVPLQAAMDNMRKKMNRLMY